MHSVGPTKWLEPGGRLLGCLTLQLGAHAVPWVADALDGHQGALESNFPRRTFAPPAQDGGNAHTSNGWHPVAMARRVLRLLQRALWPRGSQAGASRSNLQIHGGRILCTTEKDSAATQGRPCLNPRMHGGFEGLDAFGCAALRVHGMQVVHWMARQPKPYTVCFDLPPERRPLDPEAVHRQQGRGWTQCHRRHTSFGAMRVCPHELPRNKRDISESAGPGSPREEILGGVSPGSWPPGSSGKAWAHRVAAQEGRPGLPGGRDPWRRLPRIMAPRKPRESMGPPSEQVGRVKATRAPERTAWGESRPTRAPQTMRGSCLR